MKRYGCAFVIALLAVGVGAGCGGDDEETLTKAEYIEQGDAICRDANAELEKEAQARFPGEEEPSEEELTTFAEEVLKPNLQGQLNDLRDLTPPEEDAETVNAVYEKLEIGLAKVEDDPSILLSEDDPLEAATQAADDYGFKECSA